MSLTPNYEGHRRRVLWMEAVAALSAPVTAARREIARLTHLSTDQLLNIRKRKLKDLGGATRANIDAAFLALMQRHRAELEHELAVAAQSRSGVDPRVVAKAMASRDALDQLIREAEAAGLDASEARR